MDEGMAGRVISVDLELVRVGLSRRERGQIFVRSSNEAGGNDISQRGAGALQDRRWLHGDSW